MSRVIGAQNECVQCGESRDVIRASQRKGGLSVLFCATVDYWGEVETEWERHKFNWTQRDADSLAAETAYWERLVAESLSRDGGAA